MEEEEKVKKNWHFNVAEKIANSEEFKEMRVAVDQSIKAIAEVQATKMEEMIVTYLKHWLSLGDKTHDEVYDYIRRNKIRCGTVTTREIEGGSEIIYGMIDPETRKPRCASLSFRPVMEEGKLYLRMENYEMEELSYELEKFFVNLPPIEDIGAN